MAFQGKTVLRTLLSFVLAAVFMVLAFRGTDVTELVASFGHMRPFWIVLLIPVGVLSHYARALRWKYMLGHVKQELSVRNLFAAVMIGYTVNNVLPRVGEVVRPYVAGKLEGISKSTALGSVVAERIIDMVAVGAIVCLVLFASPGVLSAIVEDAENLRPLFLGGSVLALLLITILFLKSEALVGSGAVLLALVPRKFRDRVGGMLASFVSGFRVASMKQEFFRIGVLSGLIWALYALGLYLPFFAFPELAAAGLSFGNAVVLLALSSAAYILPVPGAFGTYHSFLKFALVRMYGIDEVTALSYVIVTHEMNVLITTVFGAYFFMRTQLRVSEVTAEARKSAQA